MLAKYRPFQMQVLERRVLFSAATAGHVLILSVDGLHQADVADASLAPSLTNILSLQQQGVTYNRATTTQPSDSFPGTLSYLTGAGPATTGVFYDVSYDRKLYAPGSNPKTTKPGAVVTYDESLDKNTSLLSGGGNYDASSLNPALLPVDKHGKPVYPHQFLKVNTIFGVAHQAGLFTAFSDKHPAYDLVSGVGVDETYTPELNSNTALLNNATNQTVNADTLSASTPAADLSGYTLVDASTDPAGASDPNLELTTNNALLTQKYDDLKVQAIINEINGKNPLGTAAASVPNLFTMNFQGVSVAEKDANGAITTDANGIEVVSPLLLGAIAHTDASIGRIEAALKAAGLWSSTMMVVTAKHGQDPRVGVGQLVKDDTFTNVLSSAGISVGGTSQDDGSLLWLNNQKQTAAAVSALQTFQSTGTIDVFLKGVQSTVPASQVINQILSGKDLVAAGLGNPAKNSRTPDIALRLNPGYILVGNTSKFAHKRAEHGGFAADDTNVALILAGGKVSSAVDGTVVNDSVTTRQIAVTALNALGLSPKALKGAKAEHTTALPGLTPSPTPAKPSHVVIVILENHDQNQIIGSSNAPYINKTLKATGLYYANAHGTDHDSQPNYLELFAGANPGVQGINSPLQPVYPVGIDPTTDVAAANRENGSDAYNASQPFSVDNLGAELISHGQTFAGYSEDLPSVGFTGQQFPLSPAFRSYVEKHNGWAQFQGTGTNQIPASTNQPLTAFPTDFTALPSVSFVVPNEANDLHDTVSVSGGEQVGKTGKDANGNVATDATTIQHGDAWLKAHVEAYRKWAIKHNSLLMVLFDENDFVFSRDNNIPLIVDGAPGLVKKGVSNQYVNHFNTLRTVEDMFGTGHAGLSAVVAPFKANAKGTLVPS